MLVHVRDEGCEFGMRVDRRFDYGMQSKMLRHYTRNNRWTRRACTQQTALEARANIPILFQRLDIRGGDAALQVTGDILHVFGLLTVDVARQVQVELVALDLLERNHARIFIDLHAAC